MNIYRINAAALIGTNILYRYGTNLLIVRRSSGDRKIQRDCVRVCVSFTEKERKEITKAFFFVYFAHGMSPRKR